MDDFSSTQISLRRLTVICMAGLVAEVWAVYGLSCLGRKWGWW
jgi:hypothetical protein